MTFTQEDVHTHIRLAKHTLMTLEAQGPEPTWDFPRSEMEARLSVVNWHLKMARSIMIFLDSEEAEVPQ